MLRAYHKEPAVPESKSFTAQDAQSLINLAQSAPQPNLQTALKAVELLQRFAEFANAQWPPAEPQA